jgi:hypothetical protein
MTTPTWRKSSYSAGAQQCVELADTGTAILVRDSKHPDHGHLALTPVALAALVDTARAGTLDHLTHT